MSVIGGKYHSNWAENFVLILWNGGPEYTIFDTNEISGNIRVGQHYFPEIYSSEGGHATKITREQPRKIDFTVKLYYPWTVEKINKIIAYTAQSYRMDIFINNFCDMSVGSSILQRQVLEMGAVIEYEKGMVFQEVGGAKGIQKDVEIPFICHESRALKWPKVKGGGGSEDPNPSPLPIPDPTIPTPGPGGPGDVGSFRVASERGLVIWQNAGGNKEAFGKRSGVQTIEEFLGPDIKQRGVDLWLGGLNSAYDINGNFLPEILIFDGTTTGAIPMVNGWVRLTGNQIDFGSLILEGGATVSVTELIRQGGGGNPENASNAGLILDCNYDING